MKPRTITRPKSVWLPAATQGKPVIVRCRWCKRPKLMTPQKVYWGPKTQSLYCTIQRCYCAGARAGMSPRYIGKPVRVTLNFTHMIRIPKDKPDAI